MKKNIKYSLIGILAGIITGLFSTGGGLILVPAFMYLLKEESKKARGTSVFCILFMAIASSFFYGKGHYIDWNISILCAIGGAIGGYIGAKLLKRLPEKTIKIYSKKFLAYVKLKMLI